MAPVFARGPGKGYKVTKKDVKKTKRRKSSGFRSTKLHKLASEVVFYTTGFRVYEKKILFKVATDKRLRRAIRRRSGTTRQAKKRLSYLQGMKKKPLMPPGAG